MDGGLISPVGVLLPVSGVIYFYSRKPGKAELTDRVFSVIMQVLHMMFVSTTLHSLQPFDCMLLAPAVLGPNGEGESKWVMERYPEITCTTSDNNYFRMVVAGISGFVIYTCLYFLFVMYTLYKIKNLTQKHETWVPPPGTLGHPEFIRELRAKKKRERAIAAGEAVETAADEDVSEHGVKPEIVDELEPSNDGEIQKGAGRWGKKEDPEEEPMETLPTEDSTDVPTDQTPVEAPATEAPAEEPPTEASLPPEPTDTSLPESRRTRAFLRPPF